VAIFWHDWPNKPIYALRYSMSAEWDGTNFIGLLVDEPDDLGSVFLRESGFVSMENARLMIRRAMFRETHNDHWLVSYHISGQDCAVVLRVASFHGECRMDPQFGSNIGVSTEVPPWYWIPPRNRWDRLKTRQV
jgi:hypothetical protein